jgi:hypothetical protein
MGLHEMRAWTIVTKGSHKTQGEMGTIVFSAKDHWLGSNVLKMWNM